MTLAVAILLFGFSSTALLPETAIAQDSPAQPSAAAPASPSQTTPAQSTAETPQAPAKETAAPTTTQSTSGAHSSTTAKKRTRKKKVAASGCDPATGTAGTGASATAQPAETSSEGGPAANAATAPKPCPPEKIIVRKGGVAEPSIQLAGGDQASQKRDAANQMLGSTEVNLKKISGQQLSQAQQDTVAQIRQFVDQSKAALAAGDLERGNTLAWKAKVLSEDLVTPKK